MRRTLTGLVLISGLACTDHDQWTIAIGTDAPIPQFADRLLIEILDATGTPACAGCRRQFAAAGRPWPVSFGVVPPAPKGVLLVRARLYRAALTGIDGLPEGVALLDAVGTLSPPHGDTLVGMRLMMSCFGVPSDPAGGATCDPATGGLQVAPALAQIGDPAQLPQPGSWAPSRSVPCPADPPSGMVCVPGGAFLLGGTNEIIQSSQYLSRPERVVQVSPFALDFEEMTVGQYKSLLVQGLVTGEPQSGPADRTARFGGCTYHAADISHDDLPLNCVSFDLALAACQSLGKTLPTEAQWEWAAGNLSDESTYPWGESGDSCARAEVGVGRGESEGMFDNTESQDCRVSDGGTVHDWGLQIGAGEGDVTQTGIRNLGGSLSEWVLDRVASYSDACWTPPLKLDPHCEQGGPGLSAGRSVRGGSWNNLPESARVINRTFSLATGNEANGFRCAKPFSTAH